MAERGGLETAVSREVFLEENPREYWKNLGAKSASILQRMSSFSVRCGFRRRALSSGVARRRLGCDTSVRRAQVFRGAGRRTNVSLPTRWSFNFARVGRTPPEPERKNAGFSVADPPSRFSAPQVAHFIFRYSTPSISLALRSVHLLQLRASVGINQPGASRAAGRSRKRRAITRQSRLAFDSDAVPLAA